MYTKWIFFIFFVLPKSNPLLTPILFSLFFSDNYVQFFLIRAKTEEELEAQRQQRMEEAVRKELEKANKPKRPVAPKKTEWEVEMIKGIKNLGPTP